MASVDVLVVSLGSTAGLRASDAELVTALKGAGASVAVAVARAPGEVRTFALTDLMWALACRRAARTAIATHDPRAVVYSTVTAALLWPRPGAIRFDALAAGNRPGRHGIWQRPLERRRLRSGELLLPTSEQALGEGSMISSGAVVLPIAVEPSGPPAEPRDQAAVTYAANPSKKGLDRVLAAWRTARRSDEWLAVAGLDEAELRASLGADPEQVGARAAGHLQAAEFRALLRRSRVYVTAPRREDYGLAQLEALADGCRLVTTPAPGPYAALPIAWQLDPRLVTEDLAGGLRAALDAPADDDYAQRAQVALAPFRREAVIKILATQVLPRLLG